MYAYRGRAGTVADDAAFTAGLLDRAAATGERQVRAWVPRRHVAFGRRDATADGYAEAVAAAERRGFQAVERSVGGRAVAHAGATVAVAVAEPVTDLREGVTDRYDRVLEACQRTLWDLGAPVQRGEPDAAFCPGSHSLSYRGKLAGVAQRLRADAALTAGVVVVDGREAVGDVLAPVYAALGVPFDPASVGSVARAGGPADPPAVRDALEAALVDGDPTVEAVDRYT
ncbi:MAG: lipoate--protein ligase family protein [Halobacteriaceae archaeon]